MNVYAIQWIQNSEGLGNRDFSNMGLNIMSGIFLSMIVCQIHYQAVSCLWNSKKKPNNTFMNIFKCRIGIYLQIFGMEAGGCPWKMFWVFL